MKTNNLLVKLLSRYYLTVALSSAFISDGAKREIFNRLKCVYCQTSSEADKYVDLSEREPFGSMMTLADYERECRLIEYGTMIGKRAELTREDRIILAAKGEALRDKQNIVAYGANFTEDALSEQLVEAASRGNINAIGVIALLDSYGFLSGKNLRRAERNLEKAIRWNDLDSILLYIELHPERRADMMKKLVTVYKGDDDAELLEAVAEKCGIPLGVEQDSNTFLMERAFHRGAVERGTYESRFASFVYTDVIRYEDKKRLIDNYKKESTPLYDDIPTHIDMSDAIPINFNALSDLTLTREGEVRRIRRNLVAAHTRRNKFYKPLLAVCRDEYILSMYKQAIVAALSGAPTVKLDASLLTARDLSETKDNILLRSVSDSGKMSTVFLIENCHLLNEAAARELSKYIRGDVRSSFRLNWPQVTVDLSPVLIILFGEGEVSEPLADMCDVVRIAMPTAEEKIAVVRAILDYKRMCYGIPKLEVTEGVMSLLCQKNSDAVSDIADEMAKHLACEPDCEVITEQVLAGITKEMRQGTVKFGF